MAKCFSFTSSKDKWYKHSFERRDMKSTTIDLGEGTQMHCWVPNNPNKTKSNIVLLHGMGANAIWQWHYFIPLLRLKFNIYVPDLVFYGESYTTRPDRSESFQAQSVMRMMVALGANRMSLVGVSYGGFVGYCMAAQHPEAVERVVVVCSGVCLEEKDMNEGMFKVSNVEEGVEILLPRTPDKLKELIRLTFYKPIRNVPSCFLADFIQVMCTEYRAEKKQLIETLYKDRKLANLPKINQPTLIIWGEHDQVFPLELAYRLKRHLGDNAQLTIVKKAGHAINIEKPKEMAKHLKSFLVDSNPSPPTNSNGNGHHIT